MSETAPVYLLAQLRVTDMEGFFERYAAPLQPINQRHGVEVLAGTPSVSVLEGDYDRNLTVVLRFPSAEAQQNWYADTEYQPLKEARLKLTDPAASTLIVAPAFVPPSA